MYSASRNQEVIMESSIGNPFSTGKVIWEMFKKGINPISITTNDVNTTAEKWGIIILTMFRSLMYAIVVFEIIFIFKNKKVT